MKKSEIEKPTSIIGEEATDPIPNSMMTQNYQNESDDIENILLPDTSFEDADNNRNFDPFAHILEG